MAKRFSEYKIICSINCFLTFSTLVTFAHLQCIPIDDELNYYSSDQSTGHHRHLNSSKYIIVDGDILVSREAFELSIRSPVADGASRLWPNKKIPYGFHECTSSSATYCVAIECLTHLLIFLLAQRSRVSSGGWFLRRWSGGQVKLACGSSLCQRVILVRRAAAEVNSATGWTFELIRLDATHLSDGMKIASGKGNRCPFLTDVTL